MRTVGLILAMALASAGCAAPVVLENSVTRERVDCTREAERLAYGTPSPGPGTDVPWPRRATPTVQAYDIERQCAGQLLREGFVCVTGCTTPQP